MEQDSQQLAQLWRNVVDGICELGETYYRLGRIDQARRVLRAGLATLTEAPDADQQAGRAKVLRTLGWLLAQALFLYGHELEPAQALLDEAASSAARTGDEQFRAATLSANGLLRYYQAMHSDGEYDAAQRDFAQALDLYRNLDDKQASSETLFYNGLVAERRQDSAGAKTYYDQALKLAQQSGARLVESYLARHMAFQASAAGDKAKAIQLFAHSLQLRQELGYEVLLPLSYLALGEGYAESGANKQAQETLELALEKAAALDFPVPLALVSVSIGDFKVKQGDPEGARSHYERATEAAEIAGAPWLQGIVDASIAALKS